MGYPEPNSKMKQIARKDTNHQLIVPRPLTTKHPLEHTWTLWIYRDVSRDFFANLDCAWNVSTVEDFWALILRIKDVEDLPPNWGYYFFKKGIEPNWEDKMNIRGGRWRLDLPKVNSTAQTWREILMCMVGEHFGDNNDQICGASSFSKNRFNRFGVWTREAAKRDVCMKIGALIKARTKAPKQLIYDSHETGHQSPRFNYQI